MTESTQPTLVLSQDDVADLIDLRTAIDVTRDALREQAAGSVVEQAPTHLDLRERASLRTVRGALLRSKRAGVRVTGAHSLAGPAGAAMLFDTDHASLLSIMAYPFGTLRTAAVMGVAIDLLTGSDPVSVALIGTGRNALGLLEAAALVRPLTRVRIYGRDDERRNGFVELARQTLDVPVTGCRDKADAIADADVVIASTNSPTPVVSISEVKSSALVAGMGVPAEFADDLYLGAEAVVVSSKQHEKEFDEVWHGTMTSTLVDLDADGRLAWDAVTQLCDLVDSAESPHGGLRVFRESAGGYGDIALAAHVYERAVDAGRGQLIRFS